MADVLLGGAFFKDGVSIFVQPQIHNGRISPHYHAFCEIVYVADGFTLHSVNGRMNLLMAGDIFFILPGEEHSYINAYRTKIYNILIEASELDVFRDELASLPGLGVMFGEYDSGSVGKRILHVPIQSQRSMESACEKMTAECTEKAVGWKCSLRARLVSFLVNYSRIYEHQWDTHDQTAGDYYGYIYKILRYVEQNFSSPISMNDLSEVTGLSADYMTRRFKSVLHMTPSEYVRKFRIARAMELLCTTEFSVSEIASRTGFSDVSLFSRVFKQSVGLPPAHYRKMNNE
ncbi:MAG: helix-turn-helix domain-containing protein [Clostridia bacterium]|nr:helix-turn-helix domain-containing protein [Clostridia bacterium]